MGTIFENINEMMKEQDGIRMKFVTISSCTVWHDSVNNRNRIESLLEQIFTLLLSNIIPQEEDNTCVTQPSEIPAIVLGSVKSITGGETDFLCTL